MQTSSTSPYTESVQSIYELLFCDKQEAYSNTATPSVHPWNALLTTLPSVEDLHAIATDTTAESRARLLAYHFMRQADYLPTIKELLGVVIEVALENGLDTLAAYKDGTARYINHSGKMIFWEAATKASNELIENLFAHSMKVVERIGVWDKERLPPPSTGNIRLSFLVSDGLYFGQGPFSVLEKDGMAAPVIQAATQLMMFLVEQEN